MEKDDLKTITVTIAGRNFPIKVTQDEELIVRAIEIEFNEKINEFQDTYPSRDKLDCVIMTMLSHTFDQKKTPTSTEDHEQVSEKIHAIKQILKEVT